MKRKDIEELDTKATFLRQKARDLFYKGKNKKGLKKLIKSTDLYKEIASASNDKDAWNLVIENLVAIGQVLIETEDHYQTARVQRRLARIHLHLGDLDSSGEYYNLAGKFAIKADHEDPPFIMRITLLHCIINYLKGEYGRARDFIKNIIKMFNIDAVKESQSFRFLKEFFGSLTKRELKLEALPDSLNQMEGYDAEEIKLIEHAIHLRKLVDNATVDFRLDKPSNEEGYLEAVDIKANLDISFDSNEVLSDFIKKCTVEHVMVGKSNDLTIINAFSVPSSFPLGGSVHLEHVFKSYYPGMNEIGPLIIKMKLGNYSAVINVPPIEFMIHAQAASIDIQFEALNEPMVGKSFPLRIDVTNESRGDANELVIDLELPEDESIDIVRGTLNKRFFSLAAGEETSWEIMLRPNEEGTHVIDASISFKDGEGKKVGPVKKTIPLEIKL